MWIKICTNLSMKEISVKECRKREQKWLKMLDNWDYCMQKKPEKVSVSMHCLHQQSPASCIYLDKEVLPNWHSVFPT